MASDLIETISPQKVYNRILLGVLIAVISLLFWREIFPRLDPMLQWVAFGIGILFCVSGWRSVTNPMLAIRYARNPATVVGELIESWTPMEDFKLESEYEKSLHTFLKKQLPWVKITKQYGSGRVKCDIAVGRDVMIELKTDFKSTQKLQRLIGQLELYKKEWDKHVIVVLAGQTEEDLLHDLSDHANAIGHIRIITKKT